MTKAMTTFEGSRRPLEWLVSLPLQSVRLKFRGWGAGAQPLCPSPVSVAECSRRLRACPSGVGQPRPSSGTACHVQGLAGLSLQIAGVSFCTLLPVLVSWAERRSGVLKLIKELLREKLLDHPYDEWLKRNQERPSFSLASSKNTNVCFVPDICVYSKESPRKETLAFLHLEVTKKAWELSLLFTYCVLCMSQDTGSS